MGLFAVIGPSIKDQCSLLVFRALLLSKIDLDFQKSRFCAQFLQSQLWIQHVLSFCQYCCHFQWGKLAFSPRTTKRKTCLWTHEKIYEIILFFFEIPSNVLSITITLDMKHKHTSSFGISNQIVKLLNR